GPARRPHHLHFGRHRGYEQDLLSGPADMTGREDGLALSHPLIPEAALPWGGRLLIAGGIRAPRRLPEPLTAQDVNGGEPVRGWQSEWFRPATHRPTRIRWVACRPAPFRRADSGP